MTSSQRLWGNLQGFRESLRASPGEPDSAEPKAAHWCARTPGVAVLHCLGFSNNKLLLEDCENRGVLQACLKQNQSFSVSFYEKVMMGSFFFLFVVLFGIAVYEVREKESIKERQHWKQDFLKGPHNAGLVLWFGLSSLSWAEEWKRLSAGMSGVPSNGAGRVTSQWERGLQSGGLIFSWWTQPPAPQCSLIASAEPTYGLCLEAPNDRINSACRKRRDMSARRFLFFLFFIKVKCGCLVVCRKCSNMATVLPSLFIPIKTESDMSFLIQWLNA